MPFLKTARGNLSASVTIPAFSLQIIFVFLTFTLDPDYNAPLQASSPRFRASNVSLVSTNSLA